MSERFKVFAEAPKEYFNLIPQTGVVHLLCEECPRSNAVWDMAIRDDGRVFFSACGESQYSEYARLYEYDKVNKKLIKHFNLEDKIIEREETPRTSKFHTAMDFLPDGRIITTTHTTSPSPKHPLWLPYEYANHQWEGYAGSNILIYDPDTGAVEGKGVISPFDTTYGGTYCKKTGDYFCTTWMQGLGYVYNVNTGEHRCLGQVSDVATSRTLLCSDGHIYGSTYSGKIFRYNSDTRDIEYLDAEVPGLMRHIRERDGLLYIVTGPCGAPHLSQNLFTFNLTTHEVCDLGKITPDVNELHPEGEAFFNAYGMDFDSQGRLWYSCMGYVKADERLFEWCSRLYMWDFKNGKKPRDFGIIGSKTRSIVVTAEFNIHDDVIYLSDGNHANGDSLYCGIMAIDIKEFLAAADTEERIPSHDFINYAVFPASCHKYYPKNDLLDMIVECYNKRHVEVKKIFEFRKTNPCIMDYPKTYAVSYWETVGRENTRVNKIEWKDNENLSIYCGTKKHFKVDFNLSTDTQTITPCDPSYAVEVKASLPDGIVLPAMAGRQYLALPSASVEMDDGTVIVGTKDMMLAAVKDVKVKSLGAATPCGKIKSLVKVGEAVWGVAGYERGMTNMFKYTEETGIVQLGYIPRIKAKNKRNVCIFNATTMAASPDGNYLAIGGADNLSGVVILKIN